MRLSLVLTYLCFLAAVQATIIPTDRSIAWAPGVQGGIPVYPQQINVMNAPYNAKGDGVTDDTAAIQSAINACTNGNAVFLPAGTYRTTAELGILNKSIVVRGAGPTQTKIRLDTTGDGNVFKIYTWSTNSTGINITAGSTKDSTSLTVADASSLAVGNFILVSELNKPGLVTNTGYGSPATWVGLNNSNGTRCEVQIVRVTGKSGNTVQISRPLYATFDLTNIPQVQQINFTTGCGIEDLYIERVSPSPDYAASNGIYMAFCYNCWAKDIESYDADGAHIKIEQSYACEVRDSYLHEGFQNSSGRDYGVFIFGPNSDHLIENNIVWKTRHALIFEGGGCGCVFGYNFAKDGFEYDDQTVLVQDAATHGAHPYMNLWEGNSFTKLSHDDTWGSSSHNTSFRNQITRTGISSTSWGFICVDIEAKQQFENIVGNVLGFSGMTGVYEAATGGQTCVYRLGNTAPGDGAAPSDPNSKATMLRHGNFDYTTNAVAWDSTISDHTIPISYYLTSKPVFFGSVPWPCIGPDVTPMVSKTPAQLRFEGATSQAPVAPSNAVLSIHVGP